MDYRSDQEMAAQLESIRWALEDPLDSVRRKVVLFMLQLRTILWERGWWRVWEPDVLRANQVAVELGMADEAALLLAYRAGIHEALGNWQEAVCLAQEAASLATSPESRAAALFQLGAALHDLGESTRAQEWLNTALTLAREGPQLLAIRHKLYRVYRSLGRNEAAKELLRECLEEAARSNPWLHAELLLDEAVLVGGEQPELAEANSRRSLAHYEREGFVRGMGFSHLQLGRIAIERESFEEALANLIKARTFFDQNDYDPGRAHVFLALGEIARHRQQFGEAQAAYARSFHFAEKSNYRRAMIRATYGELLAAKAAGDWTAALLRASRLTRLLIFFRDAWVYLGTRLSGALPWGSRLGRAGRVAAFAAAIALGAQATLPLGEVSFTLQTFSVLLAGFVLGSHGGASAVLLYLVAGAAGLPVFADGTSGLARLYGPTGGFLFSFLLMAAIAGIATREPARPAGWMRLLVCGSLATLTTLAIGLAWLAFSRSLGGREVLGVLLPLLPGAALKILAAAAVYRAFEAVVARRSNQ